MDTKLKKGVLVLEMVIPKIIRVVNNVGVTFLVLMMGLITIDVSLRAFFNIAVLGPYVFEAVEFMMVVLIFFGLSYCELKKSNVSVDIMVSRFSKGIRAGIDIVVYLLSIGFMLLLTWRSIVKAFDVKETETVAVALGIPIYPFMLVVAFGCALLGITLIYNLLHIVLDLRKEK